MNFTHFLPFSQQGEQSMIIQAQPLTILSGYKYINLTTFRKSGVGVATPLWFAEHQGILYTQTFPAAGKLKRIRHTARVMIASCTLNGKALGQEVEGRARIITDGQEILLAEVALANKYGLTRRIYNGLLGLSGKLRRQAPARRTYIAIEPVDSPQHSPHLKDLTSMKSLPRNHSFVPLFLNW
jgi:PPOX class probable F420-dependent enzyme